MRILIIGSSSKIGIEVARKSLESNHEVIFVGRSNPQLERTTYYPCDLLKDSFPKIESAINGLVYCPGTINLKPLKQISHEDFLRDYEINCLGALRAIQTYLSNLSESQPASIVLYTSVAVQRGMSFHTSIAAAKGGLEAAARSLASELAPQIRVNCIAPSLADTPLAEPLMRSRETLEKRHPLKRLGTAQEIASLTAFLLSEEASWITGQVIGIDGGMSTLSVF